MAQGSPGSWTVEDITDLNGFTTFSTPNNLTDKFGMPVLGSITLIIGSAQKFRRTLSNASFGMATGTLLALCGVLLIFSPQLASLPELLAKQPLPSQLSWLADLIKSIANLSLMKEI